MTATIPPTSASLLLRNLRSDCPVKDCGGKAHNLARMAAGGLSVFPGVVVTNVAFDEFLDSNSLREPIRHLTGQIDFSDPESFRRTAKAIAERVHGAVIAPALFEALCQHWHDNLLSRTLIVRSSAVGEDSAEASFAGQLDSILNVNSESELRKGLLTCWASYWSERSLFYQRSRGVSLAGMGVLIQEQAKSEFSGVLFTESPESRSAQSSERMTVEFCRGFGDALVSGKITPARASICRSDSSDIILESADDDMSHHGKPVPETLAALAEEGLRLEQLFGSPQDIEWTVDTTGKLWLLQSRNITAFTGNRSNSEKTTEPNVSRTAAPGRSVLWSNANVNENFPDPITPLLYSVASTGYYHYFRNLGIAIGVSRRRIAAMEHSLRQIIGVHGARMYYNLSNIHACLRPAPRGEELAELFNNFVGADRIADPEEEAEASVQPGWLGRRIEQGRVAINVLRRAMHLTKGVAAFETDVDGFASRTSEECLTEASLSELLKCFREFIDIRSNRWVNASFADAAAMLNYGLLKKFLNEEFPGEDLAALHNTLLKGLPDLVSNKPVLGLWGLSRAVQESSGLSGLFANSTNEQIVAAIQTQGQFGEFRKRLERYLDECGFRCSGELMLTVPSFQEQPAALIEIIKAYATLTGESPEASLRTQGDLREAETARIMRILGKRSLLPFVPWSAKTAKARCLLKWAQSSIALRERARMKQALLYSRFRRIVLLIGQRLSALNVLSGSDDIFFLTHQEIDELLGGAAMFPDDIQRMVALRKSAHQRQSELNPPDTFELPEGEYFRAADLGSADTSVEPVHSGEAIVELRGTGACGGKVTAPAAILRDVTEFSRLSQGDVLVTKQTDPGWGPVFFLIRGLVIERGGMLSHGAILAREFGIPTVVGVPNATQNITHGHTLTIDGDRGLVQLSTD